jgi:hypothetical protein
MGLTSKRTRKEHPGISPGDAAVRLRHKLSKDYDVIVIGNVYWKAMPDWARQSILNKVKAGAGLVAFLRGEWDSPLTKAFSKPIEGDRREVISAFPFPGLPAYRGFGSFQNFAESTLKLSEYGSGRLVLVRGRAPEGAASSLWSSRGVGEGVRVPRRQMLTAEIADSFPDIHMVHYDYYLAQIGHLLRWASKAARPVRIEQPALAVTVLNRQRWAHLAISIRSDDNVKAQLHYAARHHQSGEVLVKGEQPLSLKTGKNSVAIDLPLLPAGYYFLDAWVKQADKVLEYGSLYLQVNSEAHIEDVVLSSATFSMHDPVEGVIRVNAGQEIEIVQRDNFGRLVARQNMQVKRDVKTYTFSLKTPAALSILQHLEVQLIDAGQPVDIKRKTFTYWNQFPPRDDIRAIIAAGNFDNSYLDVTKTRAFHEMGLDTRMTAGGWTVHSSEALEGTPLHRWIRPRKRRDPRNTHYGAAVMGNIRDLISLYHSVDGDYDWYIEPRGRSRMGPNGPIRVPSLTNPGFIKKARRFYASEARRLKQFGMTEFNLGDECTYVSSDIDVDFSDTTIRSFQNYVREIYGTIDQLNQQYDSSYSDFDEVIPQPFDKAKASGQISMWIDHRRHTERLWAGYFDMARRSITAEYPGALVGYEGSDEPGHIRAQRIGGGEDYYLLAKSMTMNGTYYYPFQLDCVRDFSEPGTMIGGGWFGGYAAKWRAGRDALHQQWWVWNSLLRGANSIWVSTGNGLVQGDGYFSVIAADLSPFEFFRSTTGHIKRAKAGIGKLFMAADRPDDGIAVLYSPASMLLSAFDDTMPARWDSPSAVPYVLGEAGYQYRMVYAEDLAKGIMKRGGYRALYLPYAQAISQAQAAAILAFAKAGGLVIADIRPGVADEHGKPYEHGSLDVLFGIKQQTAHAQAATKPITVGIHKLTPARVDASIQLADGAKAHGTAEDTPVVITHSYGQGAGVLLNFAPSDYMAGNLSYDVNFQTEQLAQSVGAIVREQLEARGIKQAIKLEPDFSNCHVYRFSTCKNGEVLGLVWDAPAFLPGIRYNEDKIIAQAAKRTTTVAAHLQGKRHVYHIFTGEYMGYIDTIKQQMQPGQVHLFTALPYKVDAVRIDMSGKIKQGNQLRFSASLQTQDSPPGLHVLRVELIDPAGNLVEHYSRNLTMIKGQADGTISLAFNDLPGRWKLRARDVATGISKSQVFEVRKAE